MGDAGRLARSRRESWRISAACRSRSARIVLCAATVLSLASSSSAQYFGRNKVQYTSFDFHVMATEHFDIYFYPRERAGAEISARLAERWYARLTRIFGHELNGRQPLVLYASPADFAQTNIVQEELGEGTGGFTEPLRRRIVLPLAGPIDATDHVIGHELVHAFQYDIASGREDPLAAGGMEHLPLWFVEGLAEYISIGPIDSNTAMWVRDAMRQDKLPTIDQLDSGRYFPYRWGQAFWAYVCGTWGDQVIPEMFATAVKGDVDSAIGKVLGTTAKDLSERWQLATRTAYGPILASATAARDTSRLLIDGGAFGSELNVGPALSPDGRLLAFLSSRSLFSIDLYIADATTGRVVRRLTKTATSPHFASLQFIYSAAAWDAASERIAVAAAIDGRATLTIFDARTGRKEREQTLSAVDEIVNPTWAPDGHAVAFTGMSEGLTDLYVLDLGTGTVRRLTHDAYADLQPDWSPDGRSIAFVTDRFSTDLDRLSTGPYRLARLDVESGTISRLSGAPDAPIREPQWAPDGRAMYFTSTPDGVSNLYRLTMSTGEIVRLTNVATGVSGITSASPAISVARQTGAAAFIVYERGTHNIYVSTSEQQLERGGIGTVNAAMLPPIDRRPGTVAGLLADAAFGLPAPGAFSTADYASKFGLEGIGQPSAAIGVSQFGVAFGGGVSFYFSDMLRNHMLATAVQFNSLLGDFSVKDTALQVAYFNQAHRWHWGIAAGQSPYLSGAFSTTPGVTGSGELVQIEQRLVERQTERSVSGVVAYPFNRAQRVEFSGGVTHISLEEELKTSAYSLSTGLLVGSDTTKTSPAPALTLGSSSVALVRDTAIFGMTSPIHGDRYRFEVSPTFGAVNFTSVLGDYRRYFMPVSFYTIATRAVYYGRHGEGGEDSRLSPLYLGYPTLVRGYDVNSFDLAECVPDTKSFCPAFDRLVGSRMLVGNIELRFPLLRPFGESRAMRAPLEMALFADGGAAWNRGERPDFFGGTRDSVASLGITFRANLGGLAVGQFDLARPLQRPRQGWMFQFNLTPGF